MRNRAINQGVSTGVEASSSMTDFNVGITLARLGARGI
jgi:hypothetical protein